eukprot:TRINITY_DN3197_c0_g1_i1.p1 TRINITY_DN3197_c0_g1~~TRINITY_DN3197_c0_g1_i1.p1  ORF type:complete len:136 (-),score=35.64 TRINITY_DN3197_c0_g1_i1:427-834(-)
MSRDPSSVERTRTPTSKTQSPTSKTPAPEVTECFRLEDHLGDVRPVPDGASARDLSLLGLSSRDYNQLVDIFNQLDEDRSGFLDKEELYVLFQKAKVGGLRSTPYEDFAARAEAHLNAEGQVSFKGFLLCWTADQ